MGKAICVCRHVSIHDPEHRTADACADSVKFVIAAMQGHPGDPTVQKDACLMLSMLLGTTYNLAEQVNALGGNELVLKAMSNHPSDAMIQVNGRLALGAAAQSAAITEWR